MAGEKITSTTRMEAFSDALFAIIITIMVLELKAPHGAAPEDLLDLWPTFLSYVLSFLTLAVYWMNHHKLLHMAKRADNAVLWANNLLLFCVSLVPFATAYMGENGFASFPTAFYICVVMCALLCFRVLRTAITVHHGHEPEFQAIARAAGRKNSLALVIYVVAIPIAFWQPMLAVALAYVVAGLYCIPEILVEKGARMCGLSAGVSDS